MRKHTSDRAVPEATGAASVRHTHLLRLLLSPDFVQRQRLIDRLECRRSHPPTVLAMPPGFGTATLLCDWAARFSLPATVRGF